MFSRTVRSATRPSVLRFSEQNAMPLVDRGARACAASTGSPSIGDRAAVGAVGAEQQPGQLGAAGAEQPGQADDLARVDGRGRTAAIAPLRPRPRGLSTGGVAVRSARRARCLVELLQRRSSSWPIILRDQLELAAVAGQVLADERAVAQDRDPVGDLVDLVEEVRDEQDRDALRRLQLAASPGRAARPRRRRGWRSARRGSAPWRRCRRARAIATICWTASEYVASGARTSRSRSSRPSSSAARRRIAPPVDRGRSGAARGRCKMFSATDRLGQRLTSW